MDKWPNHYSFSYQVLFEPGSAPVWHKEEHLTKRDDFKALRLHWVPANRFAEAIVKHEVRDGKPSFLIKWLNKSELHNSWHTENGLLGGYGGRATNCTSSVKKLLAAWKAKQPAAPAARKVVERIVKFDVQNGVDWFFIKWKGCSENHNSWLHKAYLLATYPEFAKIRADWLVPGHPEASRPWQPTPTPQTPAAPLALGHGSSTPGTTDANTALGDRFGTNGQRNA